MGYQPQRKSQKNSFRGYGKIDRERGKERKRQHKQAARYTEEEKQPLTQQEIAEATLKRLHVLGNQKFGSFPYSEHFDRWIKSVEAVLAEFMANPNIGVDMEFTKETTQTLSGIKATLDLIQHRETTVTQEVTNLAESKTKLQKINNQYSAQASLIRGQKNSIIRRLNREIEILKQQQDSVIRQKTGFLHFRSKKKREQEEINVVEELTNKQNELELAIMDLKQSQKVLREDFDKQREPVAEEVKKFQKRIDDLDADGSLEERWFACEALADAVNMFLQRKSAKPS